MRLRATAAVAYASLAIAFVVLWESEPRVLENQRVFGDVFFAGLLLVHPVAGFLIPRLWALGLPYVALLVSLPISEPDPELAGITDAGAMFLGGFFAMILMTFGIACRLTLDAFREPR